MSGFDTIWPADSVEFCPHPLGQDLFVCGTYHLEQPAPTEQAQSTDTGSPPPDRKPQTRRGKCMLFRASQTGESIHPTLIHQTELPAVPDLKWCHRVSSTAPLLGVADSEGHITLHELRLGQERLEEVQSITCATPDVLCLSLDWSNRRKQTSSVGDLVVSLSDGSLALLQARDQSGLAISETWHAHDFEPWIAAWNYWDDNVIYSGGDDLKLKAWDIRQGFTRPALINKRFDAGVTTIQSHPFMEHIIAVGSYDSSLRIFDMRKPLTPLAQADVGGGVWRAKWHPSPTRKHDLLVACMHDGFKVVHFDLSAQADSAERTCPSWSVTKRFDQHESLAYGVDWSFATGGSEADTLVASCSFYDHALHLWRG